MKKNLVLDIQILLKMHNLNSVSIFGSRKNKNKSIAAAVALAIFLNEKGIKANVIVDDSMGLSFTHDLIQRKPLTEHFLAISVDAKKTIDIESEVYHKAFVLLNIYGPIQSKGYGVLNFVKPEVSGAAEIIYSELLAYCEYENKEPTTEINHEVATYLYMSLLAGTRQFSNNIKKNTFMIAKELLNNGMDYQNASFLLSKKSPEVLKCQEIILKEMVQEETIAYAVISKADSQAFLKQNFVDALDGFRNIGNIAIWVLFIDIEKGYDVILQSDSSYQYDVSKVARKSGGDGNQTEATARIQKFDISKILTDVHTLIKQTSE